jgi:hypothetical protein
VYIFTFMYLYVNVSVHHTRGYNIGLYLKINIALNISLIYFCHLFFWTDENAREVNSVLLHLLKDDV